MLRHRLMLACTLAAASALLMNCRDSSAPPTGLASAVTPSSKPAGAAATSTPSSPMHSMHDAPVTLAAVSLQPFTYRGAIDPYRINQLPDFTVRSKVRSDVVMQQSVFNPGAGMWHTHPGPSFIYVIQGQIKLQKVERNGCTETQVYAPGSVYTEIADQVHRAVVVSAEPAVVM